MTTLAAILLALSSLESNNVDNIPGGRYQWTQRAWKEQTHRPYREARLKHIADIETVKRLQRDSLNFRDATGVPIGHTTRLIDDAASIYALWHIGFAGYKKYGFDKAWLPPDIRDRCERFSNLVSDLEKRK